MQQGCETVLSPSEVTQTLQESRQRGKHPLKQEQEGHGTPRDLSGER